MPMKSLALVLAALLATTALLASGESATAQRQLRVGYVVHSGQTPNPADLFGRPYAAFIRAVKTFGVEGRVLQVPPNQDGQSALTFLARQKYDLIIIGNGEPWAVGAVAPKYPDTKFLFPDMPRDQLLEVGGPRMPKNVQGTVFRAQEAGYLAGYLAGLMEQRRPGRDVVGSVGGFKFPGVDRWIVGYRAGARRAAPGIKTLNAYTNSFTNFAKCRTVALDQIAKGAGVIFNVAGGCGFGSFDAAKKAGVWGVGVDVDQSYLGPHILTSAVIRVDVAVAAAVRRLLKGNLRTGGNTVFTLSNGGVGLGRISPSVPRALLRELDGVRREIIAGKIDVP
jgi:basic membrane protein A